MGRSDWGYESVKLFDKGFWSVETLSISPFLWLDGVIRGPLKIQVLWHADVTLTTPSG